MNALSSVVFISLVSACLGTVTINSHTLTKLMVANQTAPLPTNYLDFTPNVFSNTLTFTWVVDPPAVPSSTKQQEKLEIGVSVEILLNGDRVLYWLFSGAPAFSEPFEAPRDSIAHDPNTNTFTLVFGNATAHYEGNYTLELTTSENRVNNVAKAEFHIPAIRYCDAVSNGKPLVDKKNGCKVTVTPSSGCPDGFVYGGNVQATARVLDKDSKETDALAFEMTDLQEDGSSRFVLVGAGAFPKGLTKGVQMKYEFTYQQGEHEKTMYTEDIKCGAGSLSVSLGFLMGMLAILKSVV